MVAAAERVAEPEVVGERAAQLAAEAVVVQAAPSAFHLAEAVWGAPGAAEQAVESGPEAESLVPLADQALSCGLPLAARVPRLFCSAGMGVP